MKPAGRALHAETFIVKSATECASKLCQTLNIFLANQCLLGMMHVLRRTFRMSLSSEQPSGGSGEPDSVRFTPQQSETFARINNRLKVHDYLPRTSHDGVARASKCEWSSHVAVSLTPEETGALAWILIDTIMKSRFGLATDLYDTWRHHTLTGSTIPSPLDSAIAAFVEPVFGLPNATKS